ncbi:MAG: GDP-mannose 4,6-dehydratase [Ardenticatenaceae bacterium]|nr:GDP-mannose 4,6-dehydratase [Ardenticatenaceae bacterium]MCB9443001.1 GDP-mannose 4,6-dehydratase [Ardenticatenaceae bacterium]
MRAFITGATGFAGSYLVHDLLAVGHHVTALVHPATSHQSLPEHPLVETVEGDLLDGASLATAVAQAQPDVIYHLAGQAYPARSWQDPALTLAINAGGTANILQAAVGYGRPRVVVVTSAEIYGLVEPSELPLTEVSQPQPRHPYGISKWAASQLVAVYWARYQLPVVEARPFNHIGPHQALGFVVPDFASQLAAIKLGQAAPIMRVGNLDAQRDFTDVRDVARAYQILAEKGRPGEVYFICSGRPVSIHYLLDTLIEVAGVSVQIEDDPARMRPSDTPCLYGSYAKIQKGTGWRPQIDLQQSLADALADWVGRLSEA